MESLAAKEPLDDLERLVSQQTELDNILSRAERLLGMDDAASSDDSRRRYVSEIHGSHPTPGNHFHSPVRYAAPVSRKSNLTLLSWCSLAVAMTGFFCGGILLTWSLVVNRPELWNVGETVTLASQVGLLIGLILQLDRIGHDRHQTVSRLTLLDERVESLRNHRDYRTAKRFVRTDGSESSTPEHLLADLKNQLDHLATQLSEKRSA